MYIKEITLGILILYIILSIVNIKIPSFTILGYLISDWFKKVFGKISSPFLY